MHVCLLLWEEQHVRMIHQNSQLVEVQRVEKLRNLEVKIILMDLCRWIRVEFAAFPGAEGYGKNTVGGRGGKVYHVTSLDDDANNPAEGTLRWVLKQKGAKTVVFDVAGTIHLKADLKTNNDNLTIAGQTSPGGICLADYAFVINSNEVIIRFLRFRPGDDSGKEPDGLGGMDKRILS